MCSPAALKQKADPTAGTLSQNPWDEIGLRKSVHDVDIKGTNTFLHTQYRHTGVNMYIYIYIRIALKNAFVYMQYSNMR